jgi:hypothetical protein
MLTNIQKLFNLAADTGVELVRHKEVFTNVFVVLCNKGYEYVTWVANLHPDCEGFCSGHYFRYDIYDGEDSAFDAANKDYIARN